MVKPIACTEPSHSTNWAMPGCDDPNWNPGGHSDGDGVRPAHDVRIRRQRSGDGLMAETQPFTTSSWKPPT